MGLGVMCMTLRKHPTSYSSVDADMRYADTDMQPRYGANGQPKRHGVERAVQPVLVLVS
jgi:hypothetical protein